MLEVRPRTTPQWWRYVVLAVVSTTLAGCGSDSSTHPTSTAEASNSNSEQCETPMRLGGVGDDARYVIYAESPAEGPTASTGWVFADGLMVTAGSEIRAALESGAPTYALSSAGDETVIVEAYLQPGSQLAFLRVDSGLPAPLPMSSEGPGDSARALVESSALAGEPLVECGEVVAISTGPVEDYEATEQISGRDLLELGARIVNGDLEPVDLDDADRLACADPDPALEAALNSTYLIVAESAAGATEDAQRSSFATLGAAFAVGDRLLATTGHLTIGLIESDAVVTTLWAVGPEDGLVLEVARAFAHPSFQAGIEGAPDIGLLTTIEPASEFVEIDMSSAQPLETGQDVWTVGFGRGSAGDLAPVVPGQTVVSPKAIEATVTSTLAGDADSNSSSDQPIVFGHRATTGSFTGSPVVACGALVGINNPGFDRLVLSPGSGSKGLNVERIPTGLGPTITHASVLAELIALFDNQSLEGTALPVATGNDEPMATIEFVECAAEFIAEQDNFCTVVTTATAGGEWEIPGFTTTPVILQTVNGPNPVRVNPNADAIGQSFTITVVVNGTDGIQVRATHSFTVVG